MSTDAPPKVVRSSPLAAIGLVLAVLAVAGLARRPEPTVPPTREITVKRATPTEATRLRDDAPMDLNQASAADLELLPRIGPALAARIVEEREANGRFERVDELTRVRGIGPATLERVRASVTVTHDTDP